MNRNYLTTAFTRVEFNFLFCISKCILKNDVYNYTFNDIENVYERIFQDYKDEIVIDKFAN